MSTVNSYTGRGSNQQFTTVSLCTSLAGTGPIKIVFVPTNGLISKADTNQPCTENWTSADVSNGTWAKNANYYIKLLSDFPPFNPSNFSLWKSDSINTNACSPAVVTVQVGKCATTGTTFRSFSQGRTIIFFDYISYGVPAAVTVMAHEMGHAFANLADEYEQTGTPPVVSLAGNCKAASSCPGETDNVCRVSTSCPGGLTPCYNGCNYQKPGGGWYRDALSDLMYDNWIPYNQFGPVDKQIIQSYF
jgi:hypothetical protein